jgi:serine phosphatase RsbU (regulator of sigma subunit)
MASIHDARRPARSSQTAFREAALSTLVGVGVVFLIFFARQELFGWRLASYGALCGFSIYVCCRTLYALVGEPIHRREILPRPVVAAIVFFFGGALGWGIASFVAQVTGLTRINFSAGEIGGALGIAGSLGLLFGLVFYFFGVLQERLRESVERLKEAEFAEKPAAARSIQQRLLPPGAIEAEGYRVSARNLPARFVAGDFYDVFHLADGTLGLVIADVSGKGIGASLIMASVKAVVPLVAADRTAAETLTHLNRKLLAELAPRDFVALCFARYDPADVTLEIANAGLPDPYRLCAGEAVEALSVPGPRLPLGARRDIAYESLTVAIAPGQRVLFLTDGLPEAPDAAGDPLGYDALSRLVASAAAGSGDLVDRLLESVRAASPGALQDDWTVLLLERRAAGYFGPS